MTDASLMAKAKTQAEVRFAAERDLSRLVRDAVTKATAHAVIALTDVLCNTTPGRATLAKVKQSRSYQSACNDLDALLVTMAGPSVRSLDGKLRDAREALYRSAFAWWLGYLPESHAMPADSVPTDERIKQIRGLVQHGYELKAEFGGQTERAKANLMSVLERASKPGILSTVAPALIRGWGVTTTDTLILAVQTILGDASVAVESISLVDAIRPEFRPQDGIAPE